VRFYCQSETADSRRNLSGQDSAKPKKKKIASKLFYSFFSQKQSVANFYFSKKQLYFSFLKLFFIL
jgi:hypothetical protein